ncbi:MAG: DNA polymerase Y family protein [Mesorhizobium sp.]|uniref:Y-family DNA polymerase n=1 Tax=Mesorhizobium sp. TaxID=1871066 RepID=UPI000FE53555|nr:DNA polymerase Y family protein [Mesorhizobium sp.]RWI18645.1 MAG: DNA polymerase Y family protein [Mesorhizobium sp.]RWK93377.1 MAG: DNA polymerase Y family protein [Mesorhizobium sp.]TJW39928.1 MAG: DNA polymerase Y family protein [Mesorhizobium sp.]
MPRVVSLFLPMWATDRFRRKSGDAAPLPETPLVLVGRHGRRRVVLAIDAAAQTAGLRIGTPASKAQALLPNLAIHDAEPEADEMALERLALWALRRYAPIVAADPPDGLVIDTTGADHLHGGEAAMLSEMVERLAASGLTARTAVADTWGAAHALARFGAQQTIVIPSGETAQAILPLPVAALRLAASMVDSLRRLGFETIADLVGTPRAALALRFGPEPGRRLDQAFARVSEPVEPIRPQEIVEVRRNFAEPIGAAETIARYTGKLVAELCASLETRGLGARRLDLLFFRVDNRIEAIRVGTAMPVRDTKRLTRLLADKIETIDPGFGIELMRLAATVAEPLRAKQMISSLAEAPEPDVSDVIDILANRVGEDRLYRFAPVQSDVPERSVQRIAPMAPDTGEGWPGHWPRPSRLLPRPEPIETVALLPDHPPVTFTWRGVRRRVKRADGPERVFGEWWKRDAELAAVRDYFQVEDENGERYWVYRAGDGEDAATGSHRWFMHGIFG